MASAMWVEASIGIHLALNAAELLLHALECCCHLLHLRVISVLLLLESMQNWSHNGCSHLAHRLLLWHLKGWIR